MKQFPPKNRILHDDSLWGANHSKKSCTFWKMKWEKFRKKSKKDQEKLEKIRKNQINHEKSEEKNINKKY